MGVEMICLAFVCFRADWAGTAAVRALGRTGNRYALVDVADRVAGNPEPLQPAVGLQEPLKLFHAPDKVVGQVERVYRLKVTQIAEVVDAVPSHIEHLQAPRQSDNASRVEHQLFAGRQQLVLDVELPQRDALLNPFHHRNPVPAEVQLLQLCQRIEPLHLGDPVPL